MKMRRLTVLSFLGVALFMSATLSADAQRDRGVLNPDDFGSTSNQLGFPMPYVVPCSDAASCAEAQRRERQYYQDEYFRLLEENRRLQERTQTPQTRPSKNPNTAEPTRRSATRQLPTSCVSVRALSAENMSLQIEFVNGCGECVDFRAQLYWHDRQQWCGFPGNFADVESGEARRGSYDFRSCSVRHA